MPNESLQGLHEKLGRTEEKIEGIDKRVGNLEEKNESLARLTTLVEMQMDVNRTQNEQIGKVNDTLSRIDTNLTLLNAGQEQLQREVGSHGQRISEIENKRNSNMIEPAFIFKVVVTGIILAIVGLIIKSATGIDIKF